MEFRLARMDDLDALKATYRQIIADMNAHQIPIWDDIYPCEFFEADIRKNRLYVLRERQTILSAFALCPGGAGAARVRWNRASGRAIYLDRFGVHPRYGRRGLGTLMLQKAKGIAKARGFDCLRLFVVDINKPAIRLYEKNGFVRAEGMYDEVFDDGFVLHEYGYEIEV